MDIACLKKLPEVVFLTNEEKTKEKESSRIGGPRLAGLSKLTASGRSG